MFTIETRVAGIPCLVGVTGFVPGRPGRLFGPPEHCYPEEFPEIEWEVLDRRGRPAAWLERKLVAADRERIESELFAAMEDEA